LALQIAVSFVLPIVANSDAPKEEAKEKRTMGMGSWELSSDR